MMINLLNFPHNLEEMDIGKYSFPNEKFMTGDWIKYFLYQKKISREKLAEHLSVSLTELTRLEEDISPPSKDRVMKMLELLD